MLVKSYQFTGIDFGHLGQRDPNNMKQSGTYIKKLLAVAGYLVKL